MKRVVLFYRLPPPEDRWISGDSRIRRPIRRLLRGPDPIGGIDLVFLNLCAGLSELGVEHIANPTAGEIKPVDMIGALGRGRYALEGYTAANPIVTGVAVAPHPAEWPTLFDDYPVACNVVHSPWVKAMYDPWYGSDRVRTWAVGLDTKKWVPTPGEEKVVDFLIYDKIRWDTARVRQSLRRPLMSELSRGGYSFEVIEYGQYKPADLERQLGRCRAFLFLCEHETQGLAYQQAMSAGLPVLAWDPGQWLDPWRYRYGETFVPSTSVPFFDGRCGLTFQSALDFPEQLGKFIETMRLGQFNPRAFVLEHLTLAHCAKNYCQVLREVNG